MHQRVLIIDHQDSFTYNLVQLLEECGAQVRVIQDKLDQFEVCKDYTKILFSPGPGLPQDYTLMPLILKHFEHNKQILGVCLGHQAIGSYYGAELYNLKQVQHGQRTFIKVLDRDNQSLYQGLEQPFSGGLYHSWALTLDDSVKDLMITCLSNEGVIMGIKHKKYAVEGIQFHPESYNTPGGKIIIQNWLKI